MNENTNEETINKFLDFYNALQYTYCFHRALDNIHSLFDKGKTLDEIKFEFGHYQDNTEFQAEMSKQEEMIQTINSFIKEVLEAAVKEGLVDVDVDIKEGIVRLTKTYLEGIDKKKNIILN